MTNQLQVSTTPCTPFAAVSAMLATAAIVAQQSAQYIERAGDYTVHYNVVPAHVLPEATKQRHSVPAGADGVLNVAVLDFRLEIVPLDAEEAIVIEFRERLQPALAPAL